MKNSCIIFEYKNWKTSVLSIIYIFLKSSVFIQIGFEIDIDTKRIWYGVKEHDTKEHVYIFKV